MAPYLAGFATMNESPDCNRISLARLGITGGVHSEWISSFFLRKQSDWVSNGDGDFYSLLD